MKLATTKKISKINEMLNLGQYGIASYVLNSDEVQSFIREFIYKSEDDITLREQYEIKHILQGYKALYDINQTSMGDILYKLPDDNLYDEVLEKYKSLTGKEPFQVSIPTGMRSVDHDYPDLVGTLDKAYTIYNTGDKMSIEKYLRKIFKDYGLTKLTVYIAMKYDGSSLSATFTKNNKKKYTPIKATSRGDFDSNKGVDMTRLLKYRDDIKFDLGKDSNIGIQYEAIVTEQGRKELSKLFGVEYKTRRAAIAAAIKRAVNENTSDDELQKINKCINLVPINVDETTITNSELTWTYLMYGAYVKGIYNIFSYGYEIENFNTLLTGDIDQLLTSIKELVEKCNLKRPELPFSIDGLVISVNPENIRKQLGRSNNKNKWQIAYKFDSLIQRTKVKGILTTQGSRGYLGHNILFDEVEFNGVIYNKAPVNNITRFKGLDLRIGDEVLISYNADVMGYIYKDSTCRPNESGEKIKLPKDCINCGSKLVEKKDMLLCVNYDCEGLATGRILEAIRIFGLDFFGEETAVGLVRIGITDVRKFLEMSYTDLSKILVGKNLDKAWDEYRIKINKPIELSKVIDLLGIASLRTKTAHKLVENLGMGCLESFMTSGSETKFENELKKIAGINKNAKLFASELINNNELYFILKSKLNIVEDSKPSYSKTILVSGFRKNEIFEKICSKMNYGITDSGKYDILVVTPDRLTGSKAKTAIKQGKPMYTLSEFIEEFK